MSSLSSVTITRQHKENVAILHEEWEKIRYALQRESDRESATIKVMKWEDNKSNSQPLNFQRFNLEGSWKRNHNVS